MKEREILSACASRDSTANALARPRMHRSVGVRATRYFAGKRRARTHIALSGCGRTRRELRVSLADCDVTTVDKDFSRCEGTVAGERRDVKNISKEFFGIY